ncbi:MAG: dihydropteroate synthase [Bacteroidota bacterium]
MYQLTAHNHTLTFDQPLIMAIINCTPDSFYSGSRAQNLHQAKKMVDQMIEDGADILDIGGRSTRPGSIEISDGEEIERVKDVIQYISKSHPKVWMSIDTTKASVANVAINEGCRIINDISSGEMDLDMIKTVSNLHVPFVCMHMQGTPDNMQLNPIYSDVTNDVHNFFEKKIESFRSYGIEQVVLDPGFGFGKIIEHNYTLLKEFHQFTSFKKPLLAGLSRKSMIYKLLNITAEESLNGTSALNMMALMKGANILRVHDVKPAKEIVQLFTQLIK